MIKNLTLFNEEIKNLQTLQVGWDSYDAEPPNKIAIELSEKIYKAGELIGLFPSRIAPSVEEGVAFSYFSNEAAYAFIECSNDNYITAAIVESGAGEPDIWEIDFGNGGDLSIEESLIKIHNAIST